MTSSADISANITSALQASEPDLDTSIGTPIRKIIDAIAEQIAEAYVDSNLVTYQYDIDSKSGGDLDTFCALFGITRIPAQRAQGVVTFTRPNDQYAATTICVVASGTQVVAFTNPYIYAQTTLAASLGVGQTSIDIPVQAVVAGSAGNVAAGLLTTIASSVSGVTTCINSEPLTGGSDAETDVALRARFKQTVFRSLAGTSAMYTAVAQTVPVSPSTPTSYAVSSVNVLGSSKRYREQIQMTSGTASSTVTNAAYIYSDNVYCGPDIDAGDFLVAGTDYIFTPTNPTNRSNATVTITSGSSNMPDGLYDLDFEYVPQASRNDPGATRFGSGGINNRIDVWCDGTIPNVATQSVVFENALTFSGSSSSAYYNGFFSSSNSSLSTPPSSAIFIPLVYGPITSLPLTLNIGSTVYNYGSDYWIVSRNDCFGGAPNSTSGIVWTTNGSRIPANGTAFSIQYNYNSVAYSVAQATQQWRLVGTDTWIHAGIPVPIQFNLAIVYNRSFDPTAVNTSINTALATLLNGLGFDAELTAASVINAVTNVPGVSNARFLTSTDNPTTYAMQQMSVWTSGLIIQTYANGSGRAQDVFFADNQYPTFYGANLVQRANNSFLVGA
jgi:uncharacterized phage protein gp47/JayE